jgi:hypothetical protein
MVEWCYSNELLDAVLLMISFLFKNFCMNTLFMERYVGHGPVTCMSFIINKNMRFIQIYLCLIFTRPIVVASGVRLATKNMISSVRLVMIIFFKFWYILAISSVCLLARIVFIMDFKRPFGPFSWFQASVWSCSSWDFKRPFGLRNNPKFQANVWFWMPNCHRISGVRLVRWYRDKNNTNKLSCKIIIILSQFRQLEIFQILACFSVACFTTRILLHGAHLSDLIKVLLSKMF